MVSWISNLSACLVLTQSAYFYVNMSSFSADVRPREHRGRAGEQVLFSRGGGCEARRRGRWNVLCRGANSLYQFHHFACLLKLWFKIVPFEQRLFIITNTALPEVGTLLVLKKLEGEDEEKTVNEVKKHFQMHNRPEGWVILEVLHERLQQLQILNKHKHILGP